MNAIQPIPPSLLRHVPTTSRKEVRRWWHRLPAARRALASHLAPASPRPKLDPVDPSLLLGEPDERPDDFPFEDEYEYLVAHEVDA
jgi:hypothetical protein